MKANQYWIGGIHAVTELLRQRAGAVKELLVQDQRKDKRMQALRDLAANAGLRVQVVERSELEKFAGEGHQGVAALVINDSVELGEKELLVLLDQISQPLLLVLDGVTDPHNLGACLRSADAAGVDAVIVPRDNAVGLNATVQKVASGAAETVNFVVVTNLARCLDALKQRGIWLVGTSDKADTSLYQQDLTGPLAIVMGSEGDGLRRLTREACDYLVSIPMAGEVSSLNVSVATGVTLFEAVRQRRK